MYNKRNFNVKNELDRLLYRACHILKFEMTLSTHNFTGYSVRYHLLDKLSAYSLIIDRAQIIHVL